MSEYENLVCDGCGAVFAAADRALGSGDPCPECMSRSLKGSP